SASAREDAEEPSSAAGMKSARPPAARISSTTAAPRTGSRPATATCAPSAAKATAMARPMLLVAPVTSAVFSFSLILDCIVHFVGAAKARTGRAGATGARLGGAAPDLVPARGGNGTSLDDIRAGTKTSKSQLFHYFPAGKTELVGAIAAFQNGRVTAA